MLELGSTGRCTGHPVRGRRSEILIVVGAVPPAGWSSARGPVRARAWFADSAADAVARLVGPGDLVLVKGSRGTRTDVISDRLLGLAEGA